jgi:hypothetical protein
MQSSMANFHDSLKHFIAREWDLRIAYPVTFSTYRFVMHTTISADRSMPSHICSTLMVGKWVTKQAN